MLKTHSQSLPLPQTGLFFLALHNHRVPVLCLGFRLAQAGEGAGVELLSFSTGWLTPSLCDCQHLTPQGRFLAVSPSQQAGTPWPLPSQTFPIVAVLIIKC